jgi:hypothetical protein
MVPLYEISIGEPWDFEGPDGSNRPNVQISDGVRGRAHYRHRTYRLAGVNSITAEYHDDPALTDELTCRRID